MEASAQGDKAAAALAGGVAAGRRSDRARAVTALESGGAPAGALVAALKPHLTGITVAGLTGPPGAGKSTLTNALLKAWRSQGLRIAVIAVDPSSPVSGGAILGDRIRMDAAIDDDGIFVRSLASAGHLGGLSPAAVRIVDAFDAAGFDLVLIETVGTGQNEVDIAAVSDVCTVVAAPGLGDGIQAMKSGLIEIADILVVNKADRPEARTTAEQLAAAVSLRASGSRAPAIIETSATLGNGVTELAGTILTLGAEAAAASGLAARRARRARYIVERQAIAAVQAALDARSPAAAGIIEAVLAGTLDARDAARRLLEAD